MKKIFYLFTITALLASILTSCEKNVSVTDVMLDETSLTLVVEDTRTLIATVLPEDATNKNVIWSSSNTFVATVMPNGLVTAISEGMATIVATSQENGVSTMCNVKVEMGVSSVRFKLEVANEDIDVMYLTFSTVGVAPRYKFDGYKGTTSYYEIPSGNHIPMYEKQSSYYGNSQHYCLEYPYIYNFRIGHKYSIIYGSKDGTTKFYVTDDGLM